MKWTKDQENSIFAPPAQIVVSAAAGSGKTQVLTTRIIERIKDSVSPVSVEKLLIVTFTRAAAAEMKERIGKSLRNAAKNEPDADKRAFLKKQLSLLGSAQICTIDSFCYDVVKQNFFKINLPSDISIGETGELGLLKLSSLEETIDSLYCALEKSKGVSLSEENLVYADTVEKYFPDEEERNLILSGFETLTLTCGYDKRDSDFSDKATLGGDYATMILQLHKKSQSAAYPENWLNAAAQLYNCSDIPYEETPYYLYSFSTFRNITQDAIATLKNLCESAQMNGIGYEVSLTQDIQRLSMLLDFSSYDDLRKAYSDTELFVRLNRKNKNCDEKLAESIKNKRNEIKKLINDSYSMLMEFSLEECDEIRNQLYPQIKALCSAVILMDKLYYEKMTARRIIDFSTCAHLALNIISSDGVTLSQEGEALKNKYDEIYIDEFQDSNDLQDILFSLISDGRTFMVGDVKQSIYGFRNADPTIFMKKCDESDFEETAQKRKIFLSKNFRSGKSVISGVNSIFDIIMTMPVCGIDYKKEHRLDFGADFMPESVPDEKCDIVIINKDSDAQTQLYNEAMYISGEINKLVSQKRLVYDKDSGTLRPIQYRDITVLSRALSFDASLYETAFSKNGVPCYIEGGNNLFETNEVGQIIEILKLIDNSQNDISLACALRSPMFMFDENELLKIRLCCRESFCDAFYGICSGKYIQDDTLTQKCHSFMNQLSSWRNSSGFISVEELIRRIYSDTGIYSSVLSFPDGQIRRANLDLLLENAAEFERSSYNGLFNFVNYIEKIKKTDENISEAKAISEKMNVVRIMTIHKSKGLEFPVVFLANSAKAYHSGSTGANGLICDTHYGIGMDLINPLLRTKYKSPMQRVLIHMATRNEYAEEMRLLYVALTRAREKLYVVSTLTDYEQFEKMQYSEILNPTMNEIFNCKSYISLIALSYGHGADKYWNVCEVCIPSDDEDENKKAMPVPEFLHNKEIDTMLDYVYPYESSINLPNKASVSALKSIDINLAPSQNGELSLLNKPSCKKISLKKPVFGKVAKDGAFFGSAHHKLLQYINYNGKPVKEQCDILHEKGILTDEEHEIIRIDKIEEFMKSSLGEKIKNAPVLYREEPFVMYVSANEIDSSLPEEEKMCVQGIIDCFFQLDENTIALVDYKTDYYDSPHEIVKKYEKQLYYYEKALKSKFKDKIIQKYLYLLHKNDIIEL